MNCRWRFLVPFALLLVSHAFAGVTTAHAQVVRAVLFFSPTCPHCHQVITQDLPVFFGMYGGAARPWSDESQPESERFLYLFTNGQLEILLIDASRPGGYAIFDSSFVSHPVDLDARGVPRLIIDQTVLIGDVEIPQRLHEHIQQGLVSGGIDWPPIAGLAAAVATIPATAWVVAHAAEGVAAPDSAAVAGQETIPDTVEPEGEQVVTDSAQAAEVVLAADSAAATAQPQSPDTIPTEAPPDSVVETELEYPPEAERRDVARPSDAARSDTGSVEPAPPAQQAAEPPAESLSAIQRTFESIPVRRPTMAENFRRDPAGNTLSVLVLIGMIASLLALPTLSRSRATKRTLGVAIPVIALIGVMVATYLTYIETTQTTAVCGPVGDCNTVQQSKYAVLFGVIPVGLLGLVGYIVMIGAWFAARLRSDGLADWAKLSLLVLAVGGTVFSIYLTFLEPFVIGATCMWCLTSAVTMTLIMLLSVGPGTDALGRIRDGEGP
jgi:uncharacterized membrane protein